eukprot:8950213-Alexandrium_andersonii.AAC.1
MPSRTVDAAFLVASFCCEAADCGQQVRCARDKRSATMLRAQGARWQELPVRDLTELREESIALWSLSLIHI